jgi:hypothetical protein
MADMILFFREENRNATGNVHQCRRKLTTRKAILRIDIKVNVLLCLTKYTMKTYGGVDV